MMSRTLGFVDWEFELAYLNSCQSFQRFVAVVTDLVNGCPLQTTSPQVKPAFPGEHVPLGVLYNGTRKHGATTKLSITSLAEVPLQQLRPLHPFLLETNAV